MKENIIGREIEINSQHITCCATAHQLMDMRTTADVRVHNSCCAVDEPLFTEDLTLFFGLLL